MAEDKHLLYFLALLPDRWQQADVTAIKESMRERFQTKAALKSPPHITLHMPFRWRPDREAVLHELFQDFSVGISPFQVEVDGYGAFPPRVIYLQVKESQQLTDLQKRLVREMRIGLHVLNANYKDRPFRPHITVAFRDLRKAMFHEAWAAVREQDIRFSFSAAELTLLKNIEGKWHAYRQYPFTATGK